jgi:hypothetical protein
MYATVITRAEAAAELMGDVVFPVLYNAEFNTKVALRLERDKAAKFPGDDVLARCIAANIERLEGELAAAKAAITAYSEVVTALWEAAD